MKILLAADGSDYTRKAAAHLVKLLAWFKEKPEVFVHTVRPPLPYPGAIAAIGKKAVEDYEREEAQKALEVATRELQGAGVNAKVSFSVGDIASEIRNVAHANKVDLVVIGSHGHNALKGLALGSVATKLIAALDEPVMVVR